MTSSPSPSPTALLVYYSFTGQSERAVRQAQSRLEANGWATEALQIDFADPAVRLQRPLSLADVKRWTQAAEQGVTLSVQVSEPAALERRYDLVCLFSNTWQHHPCVPIRSLLRSGQLDRVLRDTPLAVYVVCRRSWKQNLKIVRSEAEAAGARFVDGAGFVHWGGQVGSLVRTVSYLLSRGERAARLLGVRLPLPTYGLSDTSMLAVANLTDRVVDQLRGGTRISG